jgi:RsbT co-antagonist protein rsbRD N-terminal domain
MELASLLEQNRETILGKWFALIAGTYPQMTSEFLVKQEDQFGNPVGHAIRESIGPIYDQVVSGMDTEELQHALDGIVRIRSVQEFTPSQAVAFVFQLKTVIRGVTKGELRGGGKRVEVELAELEARIDRVALLAFDKYTECREKLHEVRNNEIKGRAERLLQRLNAKSPVLEREEEPSDDDV